MKYALITGCSKGLGKALATQLLAMEYVIFPIVRKKESAGEWSNVRAGTCHPITADVSLDSCIDLIQESLGCHCAKLDLLINNAGIPGIESYLEKTSSTEFLALFNVHCVGALRVSQACLPFLEKAEAPRILNITSRLGSLGKMSSKEFPQGEFSYSYRVANAAQNMLTLCMAQELEKKKITVNAIHPGRMKTDSAAANAYLDPDIAAKSLIDWIERGTDAQTGLFFEPTVGELPW